MFPKDPPTIPRPRLVRGSPTRHRAGLLGPRTVVERDDLLAVIRAQSCWCSLRATGLHVAWCPRHGWHDEDAR